jgi:hypothetical protein
MVDKDLPARNEDAKLATGPGFASCESCSGRDRKDVAGYGRAVYHSSAARSVSELGGGGPTLRKGS